MIELNVQDLDKAVNLGPQDVRHRTDVSSFFPQAVTGSRCLTEKVCTRHLTSEASRAGPVPLSCPWTNLSNLLSQFCFPAIHHLVKLLYCLFPVSPTSSSSPLHSSEVSFQWLSLTIADSCALSHLQNPLSHWMSVRSCHWRVGTGTLRLSP